MKIDSTLTLEELMLAADWALLRRLAEGGKVTARTRASRAASGLYALGLATNPDKAKWIATPAGTKALREHAADGAK
jgi:hypothetical protein